MAGFVTRHEESIEMWVVQEETGEVVGKCLETWLWPSGINVGIGHFSSMDVNHKVITHKV